MVKCEYKDKIHPHRNGRYCLIDRRYCEYKGRIEDCPVYHHFQLLSEEENKVDVCLTLVKRNFRVRPDIVINIQL